MNSTSLRTDLARRTRGLAARIRAALGREPAAGDLLGSLRRALGPDGAPTGSAEEAAGALWAVAEAWEAGAARDPVIEGVFLSGTDALWRLGGDPGTLLADEQTRVQALRDRVVGWGLDAEEPEPMAGKNWRCWAFRATGLAVGHARCGGAPGRLLLDARTGLLQWDVGGARILEGSGLGVGGSLKVARVDGRKMRLVAQGPGWRREALAAGQRVIIRDRGGVGSWRTGPLPLEIKGDGGWSREGAWMRAAGSERMLSVEMKA